MLRPNPFKSPRAFPSTIAAVFCLLPLATPVPAQETQAISLPAIPPSIDHENPSFHAGNNGWWFLSDELKHLQTAGETKSLPNSAAVTAIADFHHYLKSLGIHLLVVPIPEKSLVRIDQLLPPSDLAAGKNFSAATSRHITALSKADVDVLDLSNRLIAEVATESTHADPVYCKTDSHFTSRTASLIATWVREHVEKSMPELIHKNSNSPSLGSKKEITFQGDLCKTSPETLHVVEVTSPDPALAPNTPANDPAMILMGDSHCLVFSSGGDMLAKGAGLPDYLGVEFGSLPTLVAQRGGAKNSRIELVRKNYKNKGFLKNVKLVVWCFAAREFTQGSEWKAIQYPR